MKYHKWKNGDRRKIKDRSLKGFQSFDYKECVNCGLQKITVKKRQYDYTTLYFRSEFGNFDKGGWDWCDKVPFPCRKRSKIDINKIITDETFNIEF